MDEVAPAPRGTPDDTAARERARMRSLIEQVVDACPRRTAASDCERGAQEMMAARWKELGLHTELRPFRFGTHLYANLVLHFGLAVVAAGLGLVFPWAALAIHGLVVVSYAGDSLHRFYLLRRLLGFRGSQNLLGRRPVADRVDLRIVVMAHADAAYTGLLFDPRIVRRVSGHHPADRALGLRERPLRLVLFSVVALAIVDALAILLPGPWIAPALAVLAVPSALVVLINLDVLLRNRVVAGANDNLSGCAALGALAERLGGEDWPGVEVLYVVTGAEEAGVGGAWALSRQMRKDWDPSRTVILGVDGLAGGELRFFQEAEIARIPVAPWLEEVLGDVAAEDPRFGAVSRFEMGVGATDAGPFQAAGYDAVTVGCVDPSLGAPLHYHLPEDTPSNLEIRDVQLAVEFVERLVRAIVRRRASS